MPIKKLFFLFLLPALPGLAQQLNQGLPSQSVVANIFIRVNVDPTGTCTPTASSYGEYNTSNGHLWGCVPNPVGALGSWTRIDAGIGGGGLPSTMVVNNASNTWTSGVQNFAAASSLSIPVSNVAAPTANGFLAYDSAAQVYKAGRNGTTIAFPWGIFGAFTPIAGHCVVWTVTNTYQIGDAACGSGGGGGSTSPGGIDGQVQFNSTGSFAGSPNLFWDNSNTRLGIGTSAPIMKIDVTQASGSPAIRINETDVTGSQAAQLWLTTPSGSYVPEVNNAQAGALANTFTIFSTFTGAWPFTIDSSSDVIMGGNTVSGSVLPTATAWANHAFQIYPSGTDPGCTSTAQIGKLWFNSSTSTTSLNSCVATAGTVGWVAVGSGGSSGSTGGTGAAGGTGQIQFNVGGGTFGATTNLSWTNTANSTLSIGSTAGSPQIHVHVSDATAGSAAQLWFDSPTGQYAIESNVAATTGLPNTFALFDGFTGGFPLAVDSAGNTSIGGNYASTSSSTFTAWANHSVQIWPVTTDPGCSIATNIGKLWFDNTTSTTAFKSCQNVAGTIAWVAVGTGGGGTGGGGTYTAGPSGGIAIAGSVIDISNIVPTTINNATIAGMYTFSPGITLTEQAGGSVPGTGNDVLYVNSTDHALHMVNHAGGDAPLGTGGGGGFGANPTTTSVGTNALTVASTLNGSTGGAAIIQMQTPSGFSKWMQWDANNGGVLAGSTGFLSRDGNIKIMEVQGTGLYFGGNINVTATSGVMSILDNGKIGACGNVVPVFTFDCISTTAAITSMNIQSNVTTAAQENAAQLNLQADAGGNRFAMTMESHESPGAVDNMVVYYKTGLTYQAHVMSVTPTGDVGIGMRNNGFGTGQNLVARGDGTVVLNAIFSAAATALPACNAGESGSLARVSDATGPALGATYASGGGAFAVVGCNGSAWKVMLF